MGRTPLRIRITPKETILAFKKEEPVIITLSTGEQLAVKRFADYYSYLGTGFPVYRGREFPNLKEGDLFAFPKNHNDSLIVKRFLGKNLESEVVMELDYLQYVGKLRHPTITEKW